MSTWGCGGGGRRQGPPGPSAVFKARTGRVAKCQAYPLGFTGLGPSSLWPYEIGEISLSVIGYYP
jgi:hypothetical protein